MMELHKHLIPTSMQLPIQFQWDIYSNKKFMARKQVQRQRLRQNREVLYFEIHWTDFNKLGLKLKGITPAIYYEKEKLKKSQNFEI